MTTSRGDPSTVMASSRPTRSGLGGPFKERLHQLVMVVGTGCPFPAEANQPVDPEMVDLRTAGDPGIRAASSAYSAIRSGAGPSRGTVRDWGWSAARAEVSVRREFWSCFDAHLVPAGGSFCSAWLSADRQLGYWCLTQTLGSV